RGALEREPRCLLVRQLHRPGDVGVGSGELTEHGSLVVEGVDPEPRRLPFHPPLRVLEPAFRAGRVAGRLRSGIKLIGAIAKPGDPDPRKDGAIGNLWHGILDVCGSEGTLEWRDQTRAGSPPDGKTRQHSPTQPWSSPGSRHPDVPEKGGAKKALP